MAGEDHGKQLDYRPQPFEASVDKSPAQIEREILARRIAEERAHYERGFPVAGHDFRRERQDRERER